MKKKIRSGLLLLGVLMLLTGCKDSGSNGFKIGSDAPLYPITIDGYEIVVGETKVQTLLDAGFKITMPTIDEDGQITQEEVYADTELEENSYYTDVMVWITDNIFAKFSMVTDEKSIPMCEAEIAYISFELSGGEERDIERITFNGVPVQELGWDKATELLPDFEGDDVIRYVYKKEYQCQIRFNAEGTRLDSFSVQKSFNVDWESEN